MLSQTLNRIDRECGDLLLEGIGEGVLYESVITVMMRILFLHYAQERKLLLPVMDEDHGIHTISDLYDHLHTSARRDGEESLERCHNAWLCLLSVFRIVYGGKVTEKCRFPAHDGALFDPDRFCFLEGRKAGTCWRTHEIQPLPIPDRIVAFLLESVLYLHQSGSHGQLRTIRTPFLEMGIETIGRVYEGLLNYTVRRADEVMLGLHGAMDGNPVLPLQRMEYLLINDKNELLCWLRRETRRSLPALRNALEKKPDAQRTALLRTACGMQEELFHRVQPFLGLLRDDELSRPLVILPGGIYISTWNGRRSSGTHYTPSSLTEPLVRHTLEPLLYPDLHEGSCQNTGGKLSAEEVLNLRICDMAMGSGAFLIQGCRFLAEYLIQCWAEAEENEQSSGGAQSRHFSYTCSSGEKRTICLPRIRDTRETLALRLVAENCLYGVDKNPLAVEIGKISLWLLTSAKDQPFTFLDDALKCGDALVGAKGTNDMVHFESVSGRNLEYFKQGNNGQQPDTASWLRNNEKLLLHQRPFHWAVEFPEVFQRENPGFDAVIGNPPFMGGQKITGNLGTGYRNYLIHNLAGGKKGSADLCAYFFLRAGQLLRSGGYLGLLATNTIAQGDTRIVGLEQMLKAGFTIIRATASRMWDGDATLEVAEVWMRKGEWNSRIYLNEEPVPAITSFLAKPGTVKGEPYRLTANANLSYQGTIVYCNGFVLPPEEAQALIENDPKNRNVLFPYLNGDDLNSHPDQAPSRWVIHFFDFPLNRTAAGSWKQASEIQQKAWLLEGIVPSDYPHPVAADYPDCLRIVEERVKSERLSKKDPTAQKFWWRFLRQRQELYSTIAGMRRVLLVASTSQTLAFAFVAPTCVFSNAVYLFALDRAAAFAVLQSELNRCWTFKYCSNMRTDLRYCAADAFETFPFPTVLDSLEEIGESYHSLRRQIMRTRQEGLTSTYNRFHDPNENAEDIRKLRELQIDMDCAVTQAYQWDDLKLEHDFQETDQGIRFTFSETVRREILDRLLALNHQRHQEEQKQGLSRGGRKGRMRTVPGKTPVNRRMKTP
ncbi:MAG: Eco57I restriction-modification methylase domain-containing protein [bacterium]